MSEEAPQLKRDSTMVVTAREGEAFLEGCGKVDEDAKTRGQQKEIEAINEEVSPSKLKRATTMEVTASEGTDILDGEELGKTRSETAQAKEEESEENGADENGHSENDEEKPSLKRAGTMQVTAKEGTQFLEEQGHTTDARTRGEAAVESENGEESEKKSEEKEQETEEDAEKASLKRTHTMDETLKEGEDFLKRQKTEDDTNADKAKETAEAETEDKPEEKEEGTVDEAKAEEVTA